MNRGDTRRDVRSHDLRMVPAMAGAWLATLPSTMPMWVVVACTVGAACGAAVGLMTRERARLGATAERVGLGAALAALVGARVLWFPQWRGDAVWQLIDWPVAQQWRADFVNLLEGLPGSATGLIAGMSVGETGSIPASLTEAMNASSLGHLTAVSGSNCVIAVALVVGLASMCGMSRRARLISGVAAVLGFCVVVGYEPTVVRAAVMVLLVLLGRLLGRDASGIPIVSAAVTILLLLDPELGTQVSFALSVAATSGLILWSRPLAEACAARLPRPLADAVAIPIAAQVGCLPLLVLLDARVSLGGVVANILAAPLAGMVTVCGLIGTLCASWMVPVAVASAWLAWPVVHAVAWLAETFSAHPLLTVVWPAGTPGVVLALGVTAVCVTAALLARLRTVAVFVAVGVLVSVTAVETGSRIGLSATMPTEWAVLVCDVGQGDAFVYRSGEATLMVDVGQSDQLAVDCLDRAGIERLDALALTHWDADHAGASAAVVTQFDPGTVLASHTDTTASSLQELRELGVEVEVVRAGDSLRVGELRAEVLWPPEGYASTVENDMSLVMRIDVSGVQVLALGDVGQDVQQRVLPDIDQTVGILKVAHHGSADFSELLYARTGARLALIGVGQGNSYGHPTTSAVDALRAAGMTIVRTDESGMVLVSVVPSVTLWCEKGCPQSGV